MRARIYRTFLVAAGAVLVASATAAADTVQDSNGISYEGKILGITKDGLEIDRKTLGRKAFGLNNIKKIIVEGQDDLNSAEQLIATGDFKKAAPRYEAAKLKAMAGWVKEYANARLIECYGQTGQFAKAVSMYIDLCRADSGLLPWVKLPPVMPKGSPDNDAALKAVEAALAATPEAPYADKLGQIRLNILLVQGDPAQVLTLIEKQLQSPDPDVQQRARLKQIELLLKVGKFAEAGKSLEAAKKGSDPQYEPQLLFFEGQYQYGTKDYLHAALTFMRVPIHYGRRDKDLAAQCLYWAARSMQDSKEVPEVEVAAPLKEAVTKFAGTEGAAQAQKMLEDLNIQ